MIPARKRIREFYRKLDAVDIKINEILIAWDPIGLKEMQGYQENVVIEYARYIPEIRKVMSDKVKLSKLIYEIEGERIGYHYSSDGDKQKCINSIFTLSQ
ncbi:hypothetical protein IFO69_06735 [Echinicola sp. CAU 1574]|uniref:Uncharacterized protein n=1 Tax=Echinicola arenosa TaxID=2774144 RepID=A0ABR9AIU0_9BACT|nr:hypothetical protein [Echinicola arenosa]MBD8488439.1 hypothetical protein [Echinicola arenosa]